jgi:predicted Zn-dependent protease
MEVDLEKLIEKAAATAAERAVSLYATRHPRPSHVSLVQAAEMLGVERHTVAKMCKAGTLARNALGNVPIEQIDAALRSALPPAHVARK